MLLLAAGAQDNPQALALLDFFADALLQVAVAPTTSPLANHYRRWRRKLDHHFPNPRRSWRDALAAQHNDIDAGRHTNVRPIPTSLIIPAYEEPDLLTACLQALLQHPQLHEHRAALEIIVIDDGSQADLSAVVQADQHPWPLQLIRHECNRGRAQARNSGIQAASGELLIFLDSDMLIKHPDFLHSHWRWHNSPQAVCVVGRWEECRVSATRLQRLLRPGRVPATSNDFRSRMLHQVSSGSVVSEQAIPFNEHTLRQLGNGRELGDWNLPRIIATGELSLRRKMALRVKGFDERFSGWGAEDSHFGAKLIAAGCLVAATASVNGYNISHQPRHGTEVQRRAEWRDNLLRYELMLDEPCVFSDTTS